MQWYYSKNGSQLGPVDDAELQRLAQSGELTPESYLWNETMGEQWKPASSIESLFSEAKELTPPSLPTTDGTTPNRDLMKMARESLKGHWAMAVLIILLYLVIVESPQLVRTTGTPNPLLQQLLHPGTYSPSHHPVVAHAVQWPGIIISLVCSLLTLFLTPPLMLGLFYFFLNLAKRSKAEIGDLFIGFRSGASYYWKTIGVTLWIGLIVIGWTLLLIAIPIGIVFGLSFSNHFVTSPWMQPIIVILGLLGTVGLIIVMYSYVMTYFILAETPDTPVFDCIRRSKHMMAGRKWKFFMLQLIGWSLLALLTCGIGFLWVGAYSIAAKTHFYLDVKGRAPLA